MRKPVILFAICVLYVIQAAAQSTQIRGVIKDSATLSPLSLATISVKTAGAPSQVKMADSKGEFILNIVRGTVLEVSYTGYRPKRVRVSGNDSVITILMGNKSLDDFVLIGYGKERRTDLTSSISSLSSKEINETPATNLASAMASRIPGVEIHSNGYDPGAGSVVNVRGLNSISQSEGPLYVVDGVALTGDIREINPNDIETIDVLKDAAAAGIYGSRAAAGVIIITTKKGKSGLATVDFNMYYGLQTPHPTYQMLGAKDYANLRRAAAFDADPITYAADSVDRKLFNSYEQKSINNGYKSYDWTKAVTRSAAPMQNYSIGISNGIGKNKIYFSGNYQDQAGIIINSGYKRYDGHFNIESTISSALKFGGSVNLAHTFTKNVNNKVYQQALTQSPLMPIYDSTGQPLVITDGSTGILTIRNPLTTALYSVNNSGVNRSFGNIYMELTPVRNLLLRSSIGADIYTGESDIYNPRNTSDGFSTNGQAEVYNYRNTDVLWENTATYDLHAGDHDLNLLGGYTFERHENTAADQQGTQFPTDLLTFKNMGSAGIKTQDNTNYDGWAVQSLLARVIYKFKQRYILNLTGRRDGSSRFGPNNRYGFFPSASFAWRLIDEPFIGYGFKSKVSELKFRVSYGLIGNQNLPYDAIYTKMVAAQYPFNGSNATSGYQINTTYGNPSLEWEDQHQFNVGTDIALLDNRVSLSADYYNKRITSLLMPFNLPSSSGFTTEQINIASMNTRGVDLNLSVTPIKLRNFTWQFTLNYSSYASRITHLLPGKDSVSLALRVGQPPSGVIVNYVYDGLYKDNDDFTLDPNGKPGDIKIKDLNHDGKITPQDQTIIGYSNPKAWGGFWNYFRYKGWALTFQSTYSYGQKLNNLTFTNLTYFDAGFGNSGNVTKEGGNYWTKTNTNTNIPRPDIYGTSLKPLPGGPGQGSSYSVQNGDYFRIRQITLAYDLPGKLLQRGGIRSMNVYVQALEPFLFSKYKGLDPDINTTNENYPRYRTWLVGLKLGL